jgi:predicted dehydrogenase
MKAALVGIGSFGYGWYQTVKRRYPQIEVVIVERDLRLQERLLEPRDPFYTSLTEALEREKPDFVINLTPPGVHTSVNHQAFDRRLPVLCEKPIAEDYGEMVEIVSRALHEKIPFMIAENYRRMPAFRKAHALLQGGAVGEIATMYVQFFKEAYFEKEYLVRMPDPLLQDVTVHHLDLVRYLTGAEGRRISAHSFRPKGSPYPGCAALNFTLEMDSGVMVTYAGSLSAREHPTAWAGDWRIEGSGGVMLVREDEVRVVRGGAQEVITDFGDVDHSSCLDEFLKALAEGREPESSGAEYLNTQKLVHFAQESSRLQRMLEIT